MKLQGKSLLSLFLIAWVLFSGLLFIYHAQDYIGKNFFKSDEFLHVKESYKQQLAHYVLDPFDAEKAKKDITVTQNEIDHHRNYYGSLTDQVEEIKMQYQDRIHDETLDADMKELLIQERDAKIEDIKANFESDEHVEQKIRKQKESIIDEFAIQQKSNAQDFLNNYNYFYYSLKNIETGETFESQNVNSQAVYTEKFGTGKQYFTVDNDFYIEAMQYFDSPGYVESFTVKGDVSQYEGAITIPKSMMKNSNFGEEYNRFTLAKTIFYIIWVTGFIALASLFTIAKPTFIELEFAQFKDYYLRLPADIQIAVILISALIELLAVDSIGSRIYYNYWYHNLLQGSIGLFIIVMMTIALVMATIVAAKWTWELVNSEEKLKQELSRAYVYKLADGTRDLFLNRSIGMQSVAILTIAFLAGVGFAGIMVAQELVLIYIPLLFFIALPAGLIFLRRMGYLNRIMKQTEDMAKGRLTSEIKVKGNAKSPFTRHAMNLNELREGVRISMSEQAKSERLKTELITNVSHDLRTPLTSIITYTDLLKNPNITEEEREQYINVLDKKSARLKTLIEDLFEVSKMASGNIELNKQRVDLTQLLQQAIGEHEEAFENAKLDFRLTMPDQPLIAYVDGQKMWRVIDNLIVNVLKYSLEGTRVYVSLTIQGTDAQFTVKNVSKYELNDNVEELTERFKRADASRHTDGSGLGLAIAQSIIDLHNGRMQIDVDGDLFKVVVSVPANI